MKYDSTIRELEEKRDFYAAAVSALKKIAMHENGKSVLPMSTGRGNRAPRSAETRERMAAAARKRWADRKEHDAVNNGSDSMTERELVTQ